MNNGKGSMWRWDVEGHTLNVGFCSVMHTEQSLEDDSGPVLIIKVERGKTVFANSDFHVCISR